MCSVVIPTRNRHRQLERVLRSVSELDYPNFETIVVDNSLGDDSVRRIAERSGARLIVEPRRGVSFARNGGARQSRGEIVAFLDDDVVADPRWLRALVTEFSDPAVVVVSGPYLPLEPAAYEGLYNLGPAHRIFDRTKPGWLEFAAFESPARGGNMALRASVFESWQGFEPELGRGARLRASEDCYAVLQLLELGYKFVYTPKAVVRHPFPRNPGELSTFHFRMLTEWGLYAGFLFTHGYKRAVSKHLFNRIRGYRLRNAPSQFGPYPLRIRKMPELAAGLKGILLFARIGLARKLGG